ncbi:helix-turn-helix domain-containing protein [Janthinobacterium svalbardensis]|uniref:helix-turn-helix domain-containing protein n=1 Tax=Janthinobacterium svalbardensis TaxID=368607 RepID=UPI0024482613|nr:helix-turn-helix transcriptional regulator [Janthinobacterium svalbardensis]
MDPAIAYGQVLRVLRKEAGMSQEQLAFAADIERNFVSLIERGINQPTVRVIFKLASALQVTSLYTTFERPNFT